MRTAIFSGAIIIGLCLNKTVIQDSSIGITLLNIFFILLDLKEGFLGK